MQDFQKAFIAGYAVVSLLAGLKSSNLLARMNLIILGGVGGFNAASVIWKNRVSKMSDEIKRDVQASYQESLDALSERERELFAARKELDKEVGRLDKEVGELETLRTTWEKEKSIGWEKRYLELESDSANRLQEIAQRESILLIEKREIESERERLQIEIELERSVNERAAQEILNSLHSETNEQRREIERQARQWVADSLEVAHEEIATLQGENEALRDEVELATLPKLARGRSRVERDAKEIQSILYRAGFNLDFESADSTPSRDRIVLYPKTPFDLKAIEIHAGILQAHIGAKHPPFFKWTDNGNLEITISNEGIETNPPPGGKVKIAKRIVEGEQWLIEMVQSSYHFWINGENGSGKSELLNNLYCLAKYKVFDGNLPLTLIDPKFPLSPWVIEGREFIPNYQSYAEAVQGIANMAQLVNSRISEAKAEFKAGDWLNNTLISFEPSFWCLDETDTTMSRFKKEIKDNLREGLKVGRALKVMVCYLSQSYLPDDLALRHPDLKASANLYLSNNAICAIDDLPGVSKARKLELREEIDYLQNEGFKHFALVKYAGKGAFIARLPKPKQFSYLAMLSNSVQRVGATPVPGSVAPANPAQEKGLSDYSSGNSDGAGADLKRWGRQIPPSETAILALQATGASNAELAKITLLINQGVQSQEKIILEVWGLKRSSRKGGGYQQKVEVLRKVKALV